MSKVVLITGATGQQGGAVLRALEGKGFTLRAMTRKPEGDAAKALAKKGVQIVVGDLDDDASLGKALEGAWGVYSVQNTWEAGVEKEEAQGKRVAKIARDKGVQHFVYTSVGSAHTKTGIPHFDNKARVEETVKALKFPSWIITRPVFFMENTVGGWFLHGDKLVTALDPATKLQMVAVDDIGAVGARCFSNAEALNGTEIDLAGDAVTMPEVAATLTKTLGREIAYVRIPISEVRKNSEDFALMLEWFDRVGYGADVAKVEKTFDLKMTRFADWAAKRPR